MRVFKGRLYVGSNGWGQGQNSELAAEEIRINPDDTWDVVAGKPRLVDGVMKAPISGLGDGFGNFFTAHMWRAETHNGAMYIGTNDASGAWQDPRLGRISELLAPEFGFDVWGTCDGQYWWQVTRNAFGDGKWNFGARTIQSTPFGVFIGSTNHVEGTSIWKGDASPCGSGGGGGPEFSPMKRAQSETAGGTTHETVSLARPARLVADQQVCGSGLSWDRVDGAARYRILRCRYRSFDVAMKLPPKLPGGGYLPDQLPMPASGTGPATTHRVWIAGPYTAIGVTTKTTFVDRSAAQGARYNYEVVTVGSSGATSQPSNVAAVPSQASTATFDELGSALAHASDAARPKDGAAMRKLTRLADDARTSWRKGGPSAARPILTRLHNELVADKARGVGTNRTALDDMENVVFRLERLASMNVACSHG
jgi:hypothetical protein